MWIVCSLGYFASPTERDDLIGRYEPKPGDPEWASFQVYSAARFWPRVAEDATDHVAGDLTLRQVGAEFTSKWGQAASELLDEVSRGSRRSLWS